VPYIGLDPERLSRVAPALLHLADEMTHASVGLPDMLAHRMRKVSAECERASGRVAAALRAVETVLVRLARTHLDQMVTGDEMWWFDVTRHANDAVDSSLRAHPGALVDSIDGEASIAALVFGTADSAAVREFWLTATDPARVSPAIARDRVLKLLRVVVDRDWQTYVTGHGTSTAEHWRIDHEATLLAAEVAAAWQIRLTGLAHEWGIDASEGRDLLAALSADAGAASVIAGGLVDAVWRELSRPPADPVARRRLVDNVAFAVGASTEILRASEVDRAESDDAFIDAMVHLPLRIPLGIGWGASTVLGLGADAASTALSHVDEATRRAALGEVAHRDLLAAVAVAALWKAAVEDGRASADSREIPHDLDLELQHARDSMSNQAGRGDAFVSQ